MEIGTAELNIKVAKETTDATTGGLSLEVFESLYKSAVYKVGIASANRTMWNTIASNVNELEATFRYGLVKDSGETTWSDTRVLQVTKLKLLNSAAFLKVDIQASDMSFMLQQTPRKLYKDKTIAEIVKEIADANNLKSEIDVSSDIKLTLAQAGMSDYEFIKDVLIPRVRVLPTLFYMKNGDTLVFKQRKKEKPALTYAWRGDPSKVVLLNEVKSVLTLNKSNFGTVGITFDPLKRQVKPYIAEIDANDSSELRERQFSPSSVSPIGDNAAYIDSIVMENLEASPDRTVKERVDWSPSLGMQRVALPSTLLPQAQIGTTVQLNTETAEGEKTFDTGIYLLYALYHSISSGGDVFTIAFLERRGVE